jgi:hypothetical protein
VQKPPTTEHIEQVVKKPIPQYIVTVVRRSQPMATVNVSWTTQSQSVPPTTPPLDSFRVSAAQPGQPDAAAVIVNDLTATATTLDVPSGTGYVATVALASADGTAIGPSAVSTPFDVPVAPAMLPVPVTVTAAPA